MHAKSRQRKTEDEKTLSISKLANVRLKVLKPYEGAIEIVNSADNGRVCTLNVNDFGSVDDARIYAALLRLAPELLLSDSHKITRLLQGLEKKLTAVQSRRTKKQSSRTKKNEHEVSL